MFSHTHYFYILKINFQLRDDLKEYFESELSDEETYKYWTGSDQGCLHGSAMDQVKNTTHYLAQKNTNIISIPR